MPIKRPQLVNRETYHIILRGIAGQKTFLGSKDYLRYLLSLREFNDKERISRDLRHSFPGRDVISPWRDNISASVEQDFIPDFIPEGLLKKEKLKEPLVEILTFCLMPDHVHLLIRQLADNGISLFFQKMGGYATYFNKKYERFGSLFQRPFKAIHIKTQDQLLIVLTYIHINPIGLIEPNWKIQGISDSEKVIQFLESYPWSSYVHYLGKKDLSWIVNDEFLKQILVSSEEFQNFVRSRVFQKAELKNFLEKIPSIFGE